MTPTDGTLLRPGLTSTSFNCTAPAWKKRKPTEDRRRRQLLFAAAKILVVW
jgi:hypothetical protein